MNKKILKAVMDHSRQKETSENGSPENIFGYNQQRSLCVSLIHIPKLEYFKGTLTQI